MIVSVLKSPIKYEAPHESHRPFPRAPLLEASGGKVAINSIVSEIKTHVNCDRFIHAIIIKSGNCILQSELHRRFYDVEPQPVSDLAKTHVTAGFSHPFSPRVSRQVVLNRL